MSLIFTWPGKLKAILVDSIIQATSLTTSSLTADSIEATTVTADSIEATTLSAGTGANKTSFEADGSMLLEGDATVWEDLTEVLTGQNLYVTPGKADYSWTELCVVLQSGGSLNTDGDVVAQTYQLRHATKANSVIKPHIHWEQTDAVSRQFTWKYRIQKAGQAKTTTWSDPIVVNTGVGNAAAVYVSGTLNQITGLGDISLENIPLSSGIQIKLARTDVVAGDVNATFMDIHYERDRLGSRQEYVK